MPIPNVELVEESIKAFTVGQQSNVISMQEAKDVLIMLGKAFVHNEIGKYIILQCEHCGVVSHYPVSEEEGVITCVNCQQLANNWYVT